MSRTHGQKGSWILLGLGGLAAACGALAFHRFRARPKGNLEASPTVPWFPAPADPGPVPLDWNPEQAPDGISPNLPSPAPETEAAASAPSGSEPWLEPLRLAMKKSPHAFGYGKSAWTAPLLARYLQDTRGLETPLPLVRKALKDLGYRWEHTRYVHDSAGALKDGSASDGSG